MSALIRAVIHAQECNEGNIADQRLVRPDIVEALNAWADGSHPYVGDFLRAVLSNNLKEAVMRADAYNLVTLPAIVNYVYNRLPFDCQGSPEIVAAWQATHRERRREEAT